MELKKLNLDTSTPQPKPSVSTNSSPTPSTAAPTALKQTPLTTASVTKPLPKFKFGKKSKIAAIVVAIFLIFGLGLAIPAFMLVPSLRQTLTSAQASFTALQSQDLDAATKALDETKSSLQTTKQKYILLSWLKFVPLLRNYYLDGQHGLNAAVYSLDAGSLLVEAIHPYSDLLGFKTATSAAAPAVQSAEDRIVFLVQTLDAIMPKLDSVTEKLKLAQAEVDQIDPNHYPDSLFGKSIRSKVVEIQDTVGSSVKALSEAGPLVKLLPELLGQSGEKTYMLLFQNDAELRPTGGFLTAYAYIKVLKGKITPLESNDIYSLDARFTKKLPAPEPIKKYLPLVYNWNLRDMNLSPDFKASMDVFYSNYHSVPGARVVDGIIAIDTQVPVELLKVLGPIGVGGWGNFTAETDKRCDCPQVIYALEEIADRPVNTLKDQRKAVLGPLMHSILANAMGSPKHKWPQLLTVGLDAIKNKHLMFYFLNDNSQKLAEDFNSAGRIAAFDGDYLHINDSNFGGAKSNMFTTQDVEVEYELSGTEINKTVTITYNNPHPASNCNLEAGQLCLNGVLRDWVRIYVPKGSKLTGVVGSEVQSSTTEDLDKTVFDAFFTLRPQSSSKLVFKYTLPFPAAKSLKVLIQKQPGKPSQKYRFIFDGQPKDLDLNTDLELTLP